MSNVEIHVFVADWCGHCKQFAPERDKLESTCKNSRMPIFIHNESDSDYPQFAQEAQIRGFPTIMAKVDGKYVEYEGARKADDIFKFARQYVSNAPIEQSYGGGNQSDNSFFNKYKKYKLKYLKLKMQMANQY